MREERRVLDGRVEVDDAYLGGARPGKRGCSSENNVSFVVAVQTTDDGLPMVCRMNRIAFTKEAVADWTNQSLAGSARVLSDALNCFDAFRGNFAEYQPVVVGSGRHEVTAHPEFRRVNTVPSNLRTAISGTYHHFKFAKYVDRYLPEVQYRFNRHLDLSSILIRIVRAAVLTRPRPESMIKLAEVEG